MDREIEQKPKVLNLRKTWALRAGLRMPESAVLVDRRTKWGNPYKMNRPFDAECRAACIAAYRAWIARQPELLDALPELRGKDLVCWCAPLPCHADVLLELANS